MAKTESTMLELGTKAPEFALPDVVSGEVISLDSLSKKQGLLVMFICRHCPFVKHVEQELAQLGRDYQNRDINIVAISANDAQNYPDDGPAQLKEMAERLDFTFAYLYDESQLVAQAYTAACTPDFFLFDRDQRLVYRGQLDDSRPGTSIPVTGKDLRAALDALLEGQGVNPEQRPSIGCNIKWRPGNEPGYFH
jgi:peroxiredoxin